MTWFCDNWSITNISENHNYSTTSQENNSYDMLIVNHTSLAVLDTNDTISMFLKTKQEFTYGFVIRQYVIPVICGFGLLGNLLTLVVLLCRIKEGVEMLEKGSLIGMIGKWIMMIHHCNVACAPITGSHIQKAYTSLGTSSMQIPLLSAHACMHICMSSQQKHLVYTL